jgi:hypothetical protein
MKTTIPILILSFLFGGCVFVGTNPAPKSSISSKELNRLSGIYSAVGVRKDGSRGVNLGSLIFYGKATDAGFDQIEVAMLGPDTLRCIGYAQGTKIEEKVFKVGKDFIIANGVIPIKTKLDDLDMGEPGAMHLGLGIESQEIRILESGDVTLRSKNVATGVVLVIPFALAGIEDQTFKKIK